MQEILHIGLQQIDNGQYALAIETLSASDSIWCLHHKALAYSYLENYEQAMLLFEKISKMDWKEMFYENNPFFYMGAISFLKSSYKQSISYITKATELVSIQDMVGDPRLFKWRGLAFQFEGNARMAIQDYCSSVALQRRQSIPIENPMEALLIDANVQGLSLSRDDFEVYPFSIELKLSRYEILKTKLASK